jgi:hypothetical protein
MADQLLKNPDEERCFDQYRKENCADRLESYSLAGFTPAHSRGGRVLGAPQ